MFMGMSTVTGRAEQKPLGAGSAGPSRPAVAGSISMESKGVNVLAEAANALVPTLLMLLLLLQLLLLQQSNPVCTRAWADALPLPHPSFHPIHPSRVQRALLCARSWAGHWAPRSQSTGSVGSASLPSSCPGWVRQVRDFTAERSRKPKPIIPARGAAGGGRIWAAGSARLRGPGETRVVLRWLRRPLRRSPSRTLPSPARVEFGFCARGRRGYEGFESAQAAEWSSHLFPPPATGLNFCKFKLNGAFFCCLPEGA